MSHQFLISTYNSHTQKVKTTNKTKRFLKADISHLLQFSLVHGGTGAGWWRTLWIHRAAAATVGFFDHLWEWDTVWASPEARGPKWRTESCVSRQRSTVWQGNSRVQQHLVFELWNLSIDSPICSPNHPSSPGKTLTGNGRKIYSRFSLEGPSHSTEMSS